MLETSVTYPHYTERWKDPSRAGYYCLRVWSVRVTL